MSHILFYEDQKDVLGLVFDYVPQCWPMIAQVSKMWHVLISAHVRRTVPPVCLIDTPRAFYQRLIDAYELILAQLAFQSQHRPAPVADMSPVMQLMAQGFRFCRLTIANQLLTTMGSQGFALALALLKEGIATHVSHKLLRNSQPHEIKQYVEWKLNDQAHGSNNAFETLVAKTCDIDLAMRYFGAQLPSHSAVDLGCQNCKGNQNRDHSIFRDMFKYAARQKNIGLIEQLVLRGYITNKKSTITSHTGCHNPNGPRIGLWMDEFSAIIQTGDLEFIKLMLRHFTLGVNSFCFLSCANVTRDILEHVIQHTDREITIIAPYSAELITEYAPLISEVDDKSRGCYSAEAYLAILAHRGDKVSLEKCANDIVVTCPQIIDQIVAKNNVDLDIFLCAALRQGKFHIVDKYRQCCLEPIDDQGNTRCDVTYHPNWTHTTINSRPYCLKHFWPYTKRYAKLFGKINYTCFDEPAALADILQDTKLDSIAFAPFIDNLIGGIVTLNNIKCVEVMLDKMRTNPDVDWRYFIIDNFKEYPAFIHWYLTNYLPKRNAATLAPSTDVGPVAIDSLRTPIDVIMSCPKLSIVCAIQDRTFCIRALALTRAAKKGTVAPHQPRLSKTASQRQQILKLINCLHRDVERGQRIPIDRLANVGILKSLGSYAELLLFFVLGVRGLAHAPQIKNESILLTIYYTTND